MSMNPKPVYDAVRAVCGKFDHAEVVSLSGAITSALATGNDKPVFDWARVHDDDTDGLSQLEVDLVNRGLAAARAGDAPELPSSLSPPPEHPRPRAIGPKGLAIIKRNEGLELVAYKCPAGVWTIGYGHTGPDVKPGMVITEAEADRLLAADLDRFELAVKQLAPGAPQEQFDAMVSLAFNIGVAKFRGSSVYRFHRDGQWQAAAASFLLWNKARVGGVLRELGGLTRRRAEEAALYRSGAGK